MASIGYATATRPEGMTPPGKQIPAEMATLDHNLNVLVEVVTELTVKLEALLSAPTINKDVPAVQEPPRVKHAEEINMFNRRLAEQTRILQDLLERLEL